MVTEQVKRLNGMLRECGFKRGDFSVQADRKRKTDRSNGRKYTEFGRATGITVGREAAVRAFEQRFALADAGLVVQVWENGDHVSFVMVREPDSRAGKPGVWRKVGLDGYLEKRPAA